MDGTILFISFLFELPEAIVRWIEHTIAILAILMSLIIIIIIIIVIIIIMQIFVENIEDDILFLTFYRFSW